MHLSRRSPVAMGRAPHAVVLLGLLFVAARTGNATQCKDEEFKCNSGSCVPLRDKCNTVYDCDDGSDELSCNAFTTTMDVGDVLTAHVQFQRRHKLIMLLMCNNASCEALMIMGTTSPSYGNGSLSYSHLTECNKLGVNCSDIKDFIDGVGFGDGEVVFGVQRRASELAVWLQGHPDKAITLPLNEGENQLKIRPYHWMLDMPVRIRRSCFCTCAPNNPKGTLLPDGNCLAFKEGSVVQVKPPERVTEKLRCSEKAEVCEVQKSSVKQFGTEYSNSIGISASSTNSSGTALSIPFFGFALSPSLSAEYTDAMSQEQSHGWSEQTAAATTLVCHVPAGHTGWVEIKPEFYIKKGTICNKECSDLSKWFPRTASDGSIAGERHCVVVKTTGTWRRKRRGLPRH